MTYNEWRDELKSNLLCVSEAERRKVLDYYAEAYADRRDAGFTEREIIEDFGAPYDAAQRILAENAESPEGGEHYEEGGRSWRQVGARFKNGLGKQFRGINEKLKDGVDHISEKMEGGKRDGYGEQPSDDPYKNWAYRSGGQYAYTEQRYAPPPTPAPAPAPAPAKKAKEREDYTWVFVLLCVIFCVPLFGLIMTMVGITIGFCVAPFGTLICGVASIGGGIGAMVGGSLVNGACTLGVGLIVFGTSIILFPVMFGLVKLMWKLFGKLFSFIKSLFSGKERK